ncbi:MAG: 16S rRNA (cytosine(1402)-N(4))-methyltransferase RsmH [Desulfovibrionaceae bacterium]|nr:16S rRNA (cytosine(1402)-N(4))-methyltransferase RsmH [Desulfovibrionaceae bacterium]MBF0513429.1 16S rRNA (cytosine(1402)-N(4))-methyltransferase RsmH [Desulfovibrionaceae bacterium]
MESPVHVPVLASEILELLAIKPGARVLDATVGLGGHARALLNAAPDVFLLGLDRDERALEEAGARLEEFGGRAALRRMRFSEFPAALEEMGWDGLDAVLADLGVSSMQLDDAGRGFSFLADGPLDMRMGASDGLAPASRLVNKASFEELRRIIGEYGEDPMAGRIARAIKAAREKAPIETTVRLAAVVEAAYPAKWRALARNHPATRTFQALRMAVNRELDDLAAFLSNIVDYLRPGARLAVISFHSLEDRLVKQAFRREAAGCVCPPGAARCVCRGMPRLAIVTKKPLTASASEVAANSRSRSAKLRVAERLAQAPAAARPEGA